MKQIYSAKNIKADSWAAIVLQPCYCHTPFLNIFRNGFKKCMTDMLRDTSKIYEHIILPTKQSRKELIGRNTQKALRTNLNQYFLNLNILFFFVIWSIRSSFVFNYVKNTSLCLNVPRTQIALKKDYPVLPKPKSCWKSIFDCIMSYIEHIAYIT